MVTLLPGYRLEHEDNGMMATLRVGPAAPEDLGPADGIDM